MGIDEKRDVGEEARRRLTLVRGEARQPAPHQAPKLELIVHPDRELFQAVTANDPRRVAAWLARGADVNARDADGHTPLFEAVTWWTDPAIAEVLLDRGADPRVRDAYGQTALHTAAGFGDEPQLRVLLDRGAELDARDAAGATPLHRAAALARVEAVTFLVGRGADVGIRDQEGRTPGDRVQRALDESLRAPLAQLLGGFLTARVAETRPDSLVVQVETLHTKYPEAERQARARGTFIVPCAVFREMPEPGDYLRCRRGLSPALDAAWNAARAREHGIEPTR